MAQPRPTVQPTLTPKRVDGYEKGNHQQRKFKVVPLSIDGVDNLPSSVPLIIPDNMEYDVKANTLRKIEGKSRSSFVTVQLAVDLLKKIDKEVAVLSIYGPCRSGKSYILSKMLGPANSFALGHTMDTKTFGIWLGTSYLDFGDYAMLLLDTEGIDAIKAEGNNDMGILVMTVLLSSFFIYNSMHIPKRQDFATMVGFTELADVIMVNESEAVRKIDAKVPTELSQNFPKFLWLLRDVSLEIPDTTEGEKQTPKEFMIKRMSANTKVAKAILTNFRSFDCLTLPAPHGDPEVLAKIEKNEATLLPKFVAQLTHLLEYLAEEVKPKCGLQMGNRVDGPMLALLVRIYLKAVNDPNGIPCIQGDWQTACELRKSEVIKKMVEEYKTEIEKALHGKLPVEVEAPPKQQSSSQIFLMQEHSKILQQKVNLMLQKLKFFIPTENKDESEKALIKIMETETVEFDANGEVKGGILHKFTTENQKKSLEMCTALFDKHSARIQQGLKSQEELRRNKKLQDPPNYTFRQFSEDRKKLQSEYMQEAVGPAKHPVWKDRSPILEEWEREIEQLGDYQKELADRALEAVKQEAERIRLQNALDAKEGENQRLKNEKEAVDRELERVNRVLPTLVDSGRA